MIDDLEPDFVLCFFVKFDSVTGSDIRDILYGIHMIVSCD